MAPLEQTKSHSATQTHKGQKMKHLKTTLISVGFLLASNDILAASKVIEAAKNTITCKEVVTGNEVDIKAELTYTRTEFEGGGSTTEVSKRVIDLRIRDDLAHSEMQKSPLGTDGSVYKYESVFFDAEKKQYPIQTLRLKAKVTKVSFSSDSISHLIANIVLPESRLQSSSFTAYAYLYYSLPNFPDNEYTIGLAQLQCQNTYTRLEKEPCLSIKDEQEIARIEKESQPSPFEKAVLRSLKARTVKCP